MACLMAAYIGAQAAEKSHGLGPDPVSIDWDAETRHSKHLERQISGDAMVFDRMKSVAILNLWNLRVSVSDFLRRGRHDSR